jgi:hypothetical protein
MVRARSLFVSTCYAGWIAPPIRNGGNGFLDKRARPKPNGDNGGDPGANATPSTGLGTLSPLGPRDVKGASPFIGPLRVCACARPFPRVGAPVIARTPRRPSRTRARDWPGEKRIPAEVEGATMAPLICSRETDRIVRRVRLAGGVWALPGTARHHPGRSARRSRGLEPSGRGRW